MFAKRAIETNLGTPPLVVSVIGFPESLISFIVIKKYTIRIEARYDNYEYALAK